MASALCSSSTPYDGSTLYAVGSEDDTLYAVGSSSTTTALGTTSGALAVPIDTIGALSFGSGTKRSTALNSLSLTPAPAECVRSNGRA